MPTQEEIKKRLGRNVFAYVAFWQFMCFIILICIIWVSEIMDLPALFFDTHADSVNIFRACLLTSGVLICAIITVGNTYLQQKHIIRGLIIICSSCRKVKINKKMWADMNKYVEDKTLAAFSHGLCPDCCEKMEKEVAEKETGVE